jgi:hypothetical protein
VSVAAGISIKERVGNDIGAAFIPQERNHRVRVRHKDRGWDSRTISAIFLAMNDSLEVGTCRYLPLMESTNCLRPPETDGIESSIDANAEVNSRRCSWSRFRTASTMA